MPLFTHKSHCRHHTTLTASHDAMTTTHHTPHARSHLKRRMYITPTEFSSGVQPPPPPPTMVHLLHRSTSVPGFPVADAPFPSNPMLFVFNQMLQGASSLRCLDLLESAKPNNPLRTTTSSVMTTACDCDDGSASFEDQMKALKDRGRRLNSFYPAWVGVATPGEWVRYDSLVHYQRDPLEQNLQQLVAELVSDNIIEAAVGSRPVESSGSCFYQSVFPLLLCQCESKREVVEVEEVAEETAAAQDEESGSSAWCGRSLCEVMDVCAASSVSKAEKDKEVLEMFQTLKISAYRKGNH